MFYCYFLFVCVCGFFLDIAVTLLLRQFLPINSPKVVYEVAEMVATEARGFFNNASAHGDYSDMHSISCLAPFINIMRHPLWGRVQVHTYHDKLPMSLAYVINSLSDPERK